MSIGEEKLKKMCATIHLLTFGIPRLSFELFKVIMKENLINKIDNLSFKEAYYLLQQYSNVQLFVQSNLQSPWCNLYFGLIASSLCKKEFPLKTEIQISGKLIPLTTLISNLDVYVSTSSIGKICPLFPPLILYHLKRLLQVKKK